MSLNGTENLYVIPVQPNLQPGPIPLQTTTAAVAALSGSQANSGAKASTAQLNAVSTTTLAPVTGLAVTLVSSGTYVVSASLPVSTNSTAGVKVGLVSSNSLSATSFSLTGRFFTATDVAAVNTTTLGGGIGSTTSVILAQLSGAIVVNTGGTLLLEAAQNVSTSGTTSILANASLIVTRVS